jgi:hypothetical protein
LQYVNCFYATFIRLQLVANIKPVTKYNEWYVRLYSARFNGNSEKVIIDLVGERLLDPEGEAKIAMKR